MNTMAIIRHQCIYLNAPAERSQLPSSEVSNEKPAAQDMEDLHFRPFQKLYSSIHRAHGFAG